MRIKECASLDDRFIGFYCMTQLSLFSKKPEEVHMDNQNLVYDEYKYDSRIHLGDAEATRKYLEEKSKNPDAYVMLNDLDCGHWAIKTYRTEPQKQKFLQNKWNELIGNFYSRLTNEFK